MHGHISRVSQTPAKVDGQFSQTEISPRLTAVACLICFGVALAVSLLESTAGESLDMMLVFDAGSYFGSTQLLFTCWQILTGAAHVPSPAASFAPLADQLILDGPVLPAVTALVFMALGNKPELSDTIVLACMQSFFHALTAAIVMLLGKRLANDWKAGLAAGLLWALYPAAGVASGKFLTEPLSTLVLVALVLALGSGLHRQGAIYKQLVGRFQNSEQPLVGEAHGAARAMHGIVPTRSGRYFGIAVLVLGGVAGTLTGIGLLLKAALAPAMLLVDGLAVALTAGKVRRLSVASLMLAGLLSVLAPWVWYTWKSTGHVQITPQRRPVMNLVTGLDRETDGWGSVPEAPLPTFYTEHDGTLPVAIGIATTAPADHMNLALRKVSRLWGLPWNDFRSDFLELPAEAQEPWHTLLVISGVAGMLLFLIRGGSGPLSNFTGLASILLAIGHLVYIPFVANARYGFTAMPFFVLFAAAAFAYSWRSRRALAFLSAGIAAGLALVATFAADPARLVAILLPDEQALPWLVFLVRAAMLAAAFWLLALAANADLRTGLRHGSVRSVAFLLVFGLFLAQLGAFSSCPRHSPEWTCALRERISASREITLSLEGSASNPPKSVWVLVDTDRTGDTAVVKVNGRTIDGRLKRFPFQYDRDSTGLRLFDIFTALLRKHPEDMRQWRAVAVPLGAMLPDKRNIIEISAPPSGRVTVFGSYRAGPGDCMTIPSFRYFSPSLLVGSRGAREGRPPELLPSAGSRSLLRTPSGSRQDDLSPAPGRQLGQYRILLLLEYAGHGKSAEGSVWRAY